MLQVSGGNAIVDGLQDRDQLGLDPIKPLGVSARDSLTSPR